jgi:phosphatidylglycerophosphate synthase
MTQRRSFLERARKSSGEDAFFDISAMFGRPAALRLLPYIYETSITPVHVTVLAFISGITAAVLICRGSRLDLIGGAMMLQVKNILDTLDGHLARARSRPSRIGSLLDSDTDFLVNLLVFAAIAYHLSSRFAGWSPLLIVLLALLSSLLQCSYFVYYYRCALAVARGMLPDGSLEPAGPCEGGRWLRALEVFHFGAYGWQDLLIRTIDEISVKALSKSTRFAHAAGVSREAAWYRDRRALRLASALGLGSQLFLISIMTALDALWAYLLLNLLVGNAFLIGVILYRFHLFTMQGSERQ